MHGNNDVIEIDPEKMHGTSVFRGTRVPIQSFFDYLEAGENIEIFLDHFPTVDRSQIMEFLELLKEQVLVGHEVAV